MAMKSRGRRVALVVGAAGVALLALAAWFSWPQLRFWWLFEPLGPNAQGYREYRHRRTGIMFVRVPGGTFLMGSPENETGRDEDEGLVHEVELSPFLIAKYETSQAEWERVMGSNPSAFRGGDLPVETVSWDDCQEFCRKTGLRLPTEAQWEYACRGGTNSVYGGDGRFDEMAWHVDNSGTKDHPVGQKKPNEYGVHDMRGNVAEWCEDFLEFDVCFVGEAPLRDPSHTRGSHRQVARGGSVVHHPRDCTATRRDEFYAKNRLGIIGFRSACYPLP